MAAPYFLICCHLGVRQENKSLQRAAPRVSPNGAGWQVSRIRVSRTLKREKKWEAEENQKQSYRRKGNAERGSKLKQHPGIKELSERGKR